MKVLVTVGPASDAVRDLMLLWEKWMSPLLALWTLTTVHPGGNLRGVVCSLPPIWGLLPLHLGLWPGLRVYSLFSTDLKASQRDGFAFHINSFSWVGSDWNASLGSSISHTPLELKGLTRSSGWGGGESGLLGQPYKLTGGTQGLTFPLAPDQFRNAVSSVATDLLGVGW